MEAIGRLTGGIAHDFKNTMTGIIGYARMLMTILDEHDPHYLPISEISRAGERSGTLTKQLLAFGRRQLLRAGRAHGQLLSLVFVLLEYHTA